MTPQEAVRQLMARYGAPAAVALKCPWCRQEDGLIVRLHSGFLARCAYCRQSASIAWLLRPDDGVDRQQETQRAMTARPRRR